MKPIKPKYFIISKRELVFIALVLAGAVLAIIFSLKAVLSF